MPFFTDQNPEAPQGASWPQWVEEARLDDGLAAQAYEDTPAQWRAAIKTGLALAHMHFGSDPGRMWDMRSDEHLGFWRRGESHAAPWAIVAFTPAYAAAARLAAACIPAILAGVPQIGAVCVGGQPHRSALVSLELSGVEDIFVLDSPGFHRLLEESPPGGRLVLLHAGGRAPNVELAPTVELARSMGLPCWQEHHSPTLALVEADPPVNGQNPADDGNRIDLEALYFAQAEALDAAASVTAPSVTAPMSTDGPSGATTPIARHTQPPDALYLTSGDQDQADLLHGKAFSASGPGLTLTPGCEGFWLHPGLTPDFFRVHCLTFGML